MVGLLVVLLGCSGSSVPERAASLRQEIAKPALPADYLPVPLIRQATSYSCGAAALLAVLFYWQTFDGGEEELYEPLETTEAGTTPWKIEAVAKDFGLDANLYDGLSIENLKAALQDGQTAIVDLQAWHDGWHPNFDWSSEWEDGHYVVLVGIDKTYLYFMDPSASAGYGYMPRAELDARWHDYEEVDGEVISYDHSAIVIGGAMSLTNNPGPLVRIQ